MKSALDVDLIVYLRTSPEVAHQRVKARARSEESVIPIEYLRELHDLHEKWLMDGEEEVPAPVLVVDADQDINLTPDMFRMTEENIFDSLAKNRADMPVTSPKKLARAF